MVQTTTQTANTYEVLNSAASTASYADLLVIDNSRFVRGLIISLTETGAAQSFKYKILASIKDGATQPASTDVSYHALITDVTVAASGTAYESLAYPWKWIVVQIINGSGAATVTGRARGV